MATTAFPVLGLASRDLIAQAQTGTGKTGGFRAADSAIVGLATPRGDAPPRVERREHGKRAAAKRRHA
jgi:hypothetical protein